MYVCMYVFFVVVVVVVEFEIVISSNYMMKRVNVDNDKFDKSR